MLKYVLMFINTAKPIIWQLNLIFYGVQGSLLHVKDYCIIFAIEK